MLSKYYYPHIGGVERHIECLINILKKRKFDFTIITEKFDKNLKAYEIRQGVKIYRFSYPKIKYLGLVGIWFWLLKNLKIFREADIIHIHDVFIWYIPFKLLFPRKKLYITFHGYEYYPIGIKVFMFRKISEKLTCGNICVGSFMKKWYKTKPSIVTYGAVDRRKFRLNPNIKKLYDAVFSSRLDNQTGILTYLKALEILRNNKIIFKLVVLGDGIYRKQAEKFADCRGFVGDPAEFFNKSIFAFVSRYLAILESFASKILVFAVYDNPIKEDYLKMTPFKNWIVIENDPIRLAYKIKYYKKYPDKAEGLVNNAYKWVKSQTWEKMGDNYLKLWGVG